MIKEIKGIYDGITEHDYNLGTGAVVDDGDELHQLLDFLEGKIKNL